MPRKKDEANLVSKKLLVISKELLQNRETAKNAYSRILLVHFHSLGVPYYCFMVFLMLEQFKPTIHTRIRDAVTTGEIAMTPTILTMGNILRPYLDVKFFWISLL